MDFLKYILNYNTDHCSIREDPKKFHIGHISNADVPTQFCSQNLQIKKNHNGMAIKYKLKGIGW